MPRKATPARAAKATIAVDFTDTESTGVIPEIDVLAAVDEVEKKTSDDSGKDYLAFTFKVTQPEEYAGRKLFHNCSLQPQALFNLRGLLEALGFEVPQGVMELDPADLLNEVCGISVVHEEYQGKTKARVGEFFLASELGEAEEASPPPPPAPGPATKAVKKAAAPAPTQAPAPAAAKKVVRKKTAVAAGVDVKFTDDEGVEHSGQVTALEGTTATVLEGEDEWELETTELTVV
jgi:hypothetical protein